MGMINSASIESVPIPNDLLSLLSAKLSGGSVSAWASEAIVAEAVRERIISRNKGATLLGFEDLESREDFFTRHELFNDYTAEMLAEDFKTIDQFKGSKEPKSL